MSSVTCSKCGGLTNTAVCNFSFFIANECYAKVENDIWVKGCGYENCDAYTKPSVDSLLGKTVIRNLDFNFGSDVE